MVLDYCWLGLIFVFGGVGVGLFVYVFCIFRLVVSILWNLSRGILVQCGGCIVYMLLGILFFWLDVIRGVLYVSVSSCMYAMTCVFG
jgi:hypothetical protein